MQAFDVVYLTKMDAFVTGTPIDSLSGLIQVRIKLPERNVVTIEGTPDEVQAAMEAGLKMVRRAREHVGN